MPLSELSPHWPQYNTEGDVVPDRYLIEKHLPVDCPSDNHKSYLNSSQQGKDRFDDHFDESTYRWCSNCIVP